MPSGSGSGLPTTRAVGLDSEGDLEREWNGTDSAGSSSGRSSRPGSGASLSYSAYGGSGNVGERRSLGYTTTGNGNGVISPSLSAKNGRAGGERLSSGSELSSRLGEVREWDEDAKVLPSEEILTIIRDGPEEEEMKDVPQVAVEEMLEMPQVSKHEQVEGVPKDVKAVVEEAKADKEEAKEGEKQEEEGATPIRSDERNHSLPGSEGSGGAVFDVSDYLVEEE